MDEPTRDRPLMPEGYGVPETSVGALEWSQVEDRLRESLHYWMSTTKPDGSPHVMPRWGVWLNQRFWYDGSPETLHAKNLVTNSSCALHLEDGRQSVILEGRAEPADPPGREFGAMLSTAMSGKYGTFGYNPGPDSWDGPQSGGLLVFTPAKAIAWFNFPADVTRFWFQT